MGYKLFCDRCGNEICNDQENIKIDAEIFDGKRITKVWKYYHLDCFNYEFSTDTRKLVQS